MIQEFERGPTAYPGYREERDAWSKEAKKLQNARKAKKRKKKQRKQQGEGWQAPGEVRNG